MAAVAIPAEFFTLQSMLTLTGSAGATFLICNGLQRAFNFNPRWLGLLVAEALAVFGTYASHHPAEATDYFVAVVNGFLIFATAAGGTSMGGSAPETKVVERGVTTRSTPSAQAVTPQRKFWSPWF